jgi:hypothetical protein
MAEQTYRERLPAPAVRSQVASVWVHSVAAGSDPHAHRMIPHGSVELSCAVGGLPQILGPQTVPRVGTFTAGTTVVGVRFQLGVAPSVLGAGWNTGLIAGSTLLASAVPISERPRVEGVGELSMGVAAASATAVAGPVVGLAGYTVLAVAGAAAAASLGTFLVAAGRRGVPAAAAPANRLVG